MLRRVNTLAILFCSILTAAAQVTVSGTVMDQANGEPLPGASVIIKGTDGKIKKFTSSKADGGFSMSLPNITGYRLEVNMIGYVRQSFPLDGLTFPLTVCLKPGITTLKEVTVKADRIREQGDQ